MKYKFTIIKATEHEIIKIDTPYFVVSWPQLSRGSWPSFSYGLVVTVLTIVIRHDINRDFYIYMHVPSLL